MNQVRILILIIIGFCPTFMYGATKIYRVKSDSYCYFLPKGKIRSLEKVTKVKLTKGDIFEGSAKSYFNTINNKEYEWYAVYPQSYESIFQNTTTSFDVLWIKPKDIEIVEVGFYRPIKDVTLYYGNGEEVYFPVEKERLLFETIVDDHIHKRHVNVYLDSCKILFTPAEKVSGVYIKNTENILYSGYEIDSEWTMPYSFSGFGGIPLTLLLVWMVVFTGIILIVVFVSRKPTVFNTALNSFDFENHTFTLRVLTGRVTGSFKGSTTTQYTTQEVSTDAYGNKSYGPTRHHSNTSYYTHLYASLDGPIQVDYSESFDKWYTFHDNEPLLLIHLQEGTRVFDERLALITRTSNNSILPGFRFVKNLVSIYGKFHFNWRLYGIFLGLFLVLNVLSVLLVHQVFAVFLIDFVDVFPEWGFVYIGMVLSSVTMIYYFSQRIVKGVKNRKYRKKIIQFITQSVSATIHNWPSSPKT